MEHKISWSQGYITAVTQEGEGEANAENITFHQKFRRGDRKSVV